MLNNAFISKLQKLQVPWLMILTQSQVRKLLHFVIRTLKAKLSPYAPVQLLMISQESWNTQEKASWWSAKMQEAK